MFPMRNCSSAYCNLQSVLYTKLQTVLVSLRAYDQNEGAFTLVQRSQARVNIFDSGFVLGDVCSDSLCFESE